MIAHHEWALRRLYAASQERNRRRLDYVAAIGTPLEADARALLRDAAEYLAACRRLVDQADHREQTNGRPRAAEPERVFQL